MEPGSCGQRDRVPHRFGTRGGRRLRLVESRRSRWVWSRLIGSGLRRRRLDSRFTLLQRLADHRRRWCGLRCTGGRLLRCLLGRRFGRLRNGRGLRGNGLGGCRLALVAAPAGRQQYYGDENNGSKRAHASDRAYRLPHSNPRVRSEPCSIPQVFPAGRAGNFADSVRDSG